jgi:RNA polymerase sigma-70 factor (ECF subfamily)
MNDSLLISLLNNSNVEAYKQLFEKYYSPLCEYASQFVGDGDAEELVQDFMLFIWEIRRDMVIENSLKSYLFIAVKHRCLNHIKKQRFHQRVYEWIYEKLKDQFDDPDHYMINELAEQIQKAIAELPENYRETFALSRFGEQTNVKIAEQLGVSVKTVEYRISQSLKILRVKLKDYLPFVLFLIGEN